MAKKRENISKKVRFEVFKRDSFTCQYCGRSAPDVILEVDHIVPVAQGGDNSILNLVTSCRDCNRGKSARVLSDQSTLKKQKAQLDELNERREQMEMMVKWKEMLAELLDGQVDSIENYIQSISEHSLTERGRSNIKALIRRFGFSEVYTSTEIAFDKYFLGAGRSIEFTFNKIGGVCYNRRKQAQEDGR